MRQNGICRRVVGVLFVVLLLTTWSFSISGLAITNGNSEINTKETLSAANSKDQKANSLYYKYYLILKARNKMHKV
jgi:hypothetical protein